jgi:halogenation protein CepH
MTEPTEIFDLVVIGGGPGGATLATFVAMQGHRVLLLERERLPRYQIGESLLPITTNLICAMLGVCGELDAAGFITKRGGTFRWGTSAEPWTFDFSQSPIMGQLGASTAFQVERAKFDHILIKNAERHGVEVREQAAVLELLIKDERIAGVRYQDAEARARVVRAQFVGDASGHQSPFYKAAGERIFSRFFQNVALFAYFRDGKRMPPPREGNILCVAFDHGWFWYIPLSSTLTSVGAVVDRKYAHELQRGQEQAMNHFINACPMIKEYLSSATRVTEGIYGQYRVRKDYSYTVTRFWRPGLCLVGDAACFVDPVFSTGVHLATYSALLAARSVNTCLRGGLDEARCFEEFERRYRREYGIVYDFLLTFYDMHRNEDSYFWSARKVLNTEERSNEAFVSLVAGGSATTHDFFQERINIGDDGDRLIAFFKDREFGTKELEEQLVLGPHRAQEQPPLFEGGLIPSGDGLHWAVPELAHVRREDVLYVPYPITCDLIGSDRKKAVRVQYNGRAIALSSNALSFLESLAQHREFVAEEAVRWNPTGALYDWRGVEAALTLLLREGAITKHRH